jgi:hypothetical protein
MADAQKVWVLVISHRHGTGVDGVFASPESADAALYNWVDQYWDEEVRGAEPRPDDPKEAIAVYFDHVEEWYDITVHEVLP